MQSGLIKNTDPLVVVWMVTYNHEKFIKQAILSIVSQKTDFGVLLIIGEDNSTDKTREICLTLKNQYPDKIKLLLNEKNLGGMDNALNVYEHCFKSGAKYIAMCEGDDYWTDLNKLQKQIDFLEANPDYTICFTGYKALNEFTDEEIKHLPKPQSINLETLLKQNTYSTSTVVFRSEYMNPIPEWFSKMIFGDWSLYLNILFVSKKKAFCMEDITAVYRIHSGGVHGNLHASNRKLAEAFKQHIDFYRSIKEYLLKDNFDQIIAQCIRKRKRIISSLLYKEKDIIGAIRNWFY